MIPSRTPLAGSLSISAGFNGCPARLITSTRRADERGNDLQETYLSRFPDGFSPPAHPFTSPSMASWLPTNPFHPLPHSPLSSTSAIHQLPPRPSRALVCEPFASRPFLTVARPELVSRLGVDPPSLNNPSDESLSLSLSILVSTLRFFGVEAETAGEDRAEERDLTDPLLPGRLNDGLGGGLSELECEEDIGREGVEADPIAAGRGLGRGFFVLEMIGPLGVLPGVSSKNDSMGGEF